MTRVCAHTHTSTLHTYTLLPPPPPPHSLLDGTHHYDELCCAENMSYAELDRAIEEVADGVEGDAIAVFWK